MSAILYNYLPTELVYTIYEYLHRIYMLEVCKEIDKVQAILYAMNCPRNCMIGECDCEGDFDWKSGEYFKCYFDRNWYYRIQYDTKLKLLAIKVNKLP